MKDSEEALNTRIYAKAHGDSDAEVCGETSIEDVTTKDCAKTCETFEVQGDASAEGLVEDQAGGTGQEDGHLEADNPMTRVSWTIHRLSDQKDPVCLVPHTNACPVAHLVMSQV